MGPLMCDALLITQLDGEFLLHPAQDILTDGHPDLKTASGEAQLSLTC